MKKTREEILEKHCPSMNNLYLDKQGRAFRDRILLAMKEYAEQTDVNPLVSGSVLPTEDELKVRLDELPYTKHLDDGQYNDGQAYGFECGARWVMDYVKGKTDR